MPSLVVFDISISIDGYTRGPNPGPGNVLGDGGEQLHAWAGDGATDADRKILEAGIGGAGAIICGRRTYDDSLPSWRADGPTGPARLPVFVVSHSLPSDPPAGGVYRFADGITSALSAATAAAGGKVVCIMGGADIGRQFLNAGLVDELSLHMAPIMLGGGTRMFEHGLATPLGLRVRSVVDTPAATHIRYAIGNRDRAAA